MMGEKVPVRATIDPLAQEDPFVRQAVPLINKYISDYGQYTEIGAHGRDLSWKFLGVAEERQPDGSLSYRVVGYGNFQHFSRTNGRVFQIAVATNIHNEVFVSAADMRGDFPRALRESVLRGLEISLKPKRLRLFLLAEKRDLITNGSLPK